MVIDEDRLFKVLANGARRDILRLLRQQQDNAKLTISNGEGWPAGDIERQMGLSQSTVSAHLSALEDAQLIGFRKVGQWRFYYRNEQALAQARDLVSRALTGE